MGWLSSWFSKRPLLDVPSRVWIDRHLAWLQEQFGEDRLIVEPMIEPTDQFFPDRYDRTPAALGLLFSRVCAHMEVDPDRFALQIFRQNSSLGLVTADGHSLGFAGGTYQSAASREHIRIEEDALNDPLSAVGTLSHELAHARLMGESRIDPRRFDNELLTDLCTVYFGFGVFRANRPAYSIPTDATWPGTGLWRPEYMTIPMYAYALALIADLRFEENPKWARHLTRTARAEFVAAQRARRQQI